MSMWKKVIDDDLLEKMVRLSSSSWTEPHLQSLVEEFGWNKIEGSDNIDTGTAHTLVPDRLTGGDTQHCRFYLSFCVFYDKDGWQIIEPDETEFNERVDEELINEASAYAGWTLHRDVTRSDFDEVWTCACDLVRRKLGEPETIFANSDSQFVSNCAAWRLGDCVIAIAQTDDIASYSQYDMCALWLVSRDSAEPLPDEDFFIEWLMRGGDMGAE